MNFINSWKSNSKQGDKIELVIRLLKLTIFKLQIDFSKKQFEIMLFNIGLKK